MGFCICDVVNFIIYELVLKVDIDFVGLILICRVDINLYMYCIFFGVFLIFLI